MKLDMRKLNMKRNIHSYAVLLILWLVFAYILNSCLPSSIPTITGSEEGYQITFVNKDSSSEGFEMAFTLNVQGENLVINDPRCIFETQTYSCDLGVIGVNKAIIPVKVTGNRVSCTIFNRTFSQFTINACRVEPDL